MRRLVQNLKKGKKNTLNQNDVAKIFLHKCKAKLVPMLKYYEKVETCDVLIY